MARVVNLLDFRRRRAERQAAAASHPVVCGGPNATVLRLIAETYVPLGYEVGLWTLHSGQVGHTLRCDLDTGLYVTRCGLITRQPRRAGQQNRPCRRCFPS